MGEGKQRGEGREGGQEGGQEGGRSGGREGGGKERHLLREYRFVAHAAYVSNVSSAFAVVRMAVARDVSSLDGLPAMRAHKTGRVIVCRSHQKYLKYNIYKKPIDDKIRSTATQ